MMRSYKISEEGYHPFLISDGWQVAKLNYTDDQHVKNIKKIECHGQTDEVFILLKGRAALILAEMVNGIPVFEVFLVEPGIVYNVEVNSWHNIAMEEESELLIVERSNTHLNDVTYKDLTEDSVKEMRSMVEKAFSK